MKMSLIKKEVERNKGFQYWKEAIGLSFEDFDILELVENNTKFLVHKEGKKDIGNYEVYIANGVVESFSFDLHTEKARQCILKLIGYEKAS